MRQPSYPDNHHPARHQADSVVRIPTMRFTQRKYTPHTNVGQTYVKVEAGKLSLPSRNAPRSMTEPHMETP